MKNQVKFNSAKEQASNTAVTEKDAIRPSIPLKDSAIVPSISFDETKGEELDVKKQSQDVISIEETINQAEITTGEPKTEPTKLEIKEELKSHKPALSLEQTLLLVKELGERTAHRATYLGYIDSLNNFVVSQNDDDMGKKDDPSFKGCELRIKDGEGNVFVTHSASVIFGTVEFMKGRFNERLAEVEAEIVIPL